MEVARYAGSIVFPLTINGKTLKNRCVVTPMLMNFCEEDGTCTERFAAYHEAKAKGGFAMIVTENVAVTSAAKGYQWIPGLWKDEHIPGFRNLTDRVHQYDTVIIAQLNHPGLSRPLKSMPKPSPGRRLPSRTPTTMRRCPMR